MAKSYPEAVLTARWRLIDAIRAAAVRAAEWQVSGENIDRPLADTPWLAASRYGNAEFDARWYSVMGAKTAFVEAIAGAVADEIDTLFAIAFMEGMKAGGTPTKEGLT